MPDDSSHVWVWRVGESVEDRVGRVALAGEWEARGDGEGYISKTLFWAGKGRNRL